MKLALVGKVCFGLLGGAFVGLTVSVFVNIILLEVSTSMIFSILVGVMLLLMGCLILYRVYVMSQTVPDEKSKYLVILFAGLVMLSGVCCFALDINFFVFSPVFKLPMYILLGISLWFSLSFLIIDMMNYVSGMISNRMKSAGPVKPVISSPTQIFLTLLLAVALGAYFGLVFGSFNVEAEYKKLPKDNKYTVPVGVAVCALFGVVNQVFLQPEPPVEYFKANTYDDGI